MFNVRLAGDVLYGKRLFTWVSLVMSLMVSYFCVVLFSHGTFWIRSATKPSQILRIFLPIFVERSSNELIDGLPAKA